MNAKDVIRLSLAQSEGLLMSLLADMQSEPMTMPTPRGGNHPAWVLGHLAYSEAGIVGRFIGGGENSLAKWKELFAASTTPVADVSKYPSWDELMSAFKHAREATLKTLAGLSEADLDRPTNVPENMKAFFGTVGQVLMMVSTHCGFHAGQVADARRAAGKKPVFG